MTDLQSLTHLELILVREVFHESRDFQTLALALLQELKRYDLQSVLDSGRDFTRMRARNFGDRIRLPYDKDILDLSEVIPGFSSHRVADHQEVC